jgi:large subunit ribosomal protein L21
MYAIIKTGGKQYRVQQGESLLVERLPAGDGETVALAPLLFVDGSEVVDGDGLADITVEAKIVAHERGPKLRIVKFKPKRGYKRRTGHRQELTRIEVTSLGRAAKRSATSRRKPEAEAKPPAEAKPTAEAEPAAVQPAATEPEETNGT